MKRMKCLALTLIFCLLFGMNVSAEEHYSIDGTITVKPAEGGYVNINGIDAEPWIEGSSHTPPTQEECKALLGVNADCVIHMADVSLWSEDGDEQLTIPAGMSVTLRFAVPEVTSDSKVIVRHWKDDGTVEDLKPSLIENGHIEVAFTSLSPIAIIVSNEKVVDDGQNKNEGQTTTDNGSSSENKKSDHSSSKSSDAENTATTAAATTAATDDASKVSPKTGENSSIYVAELLALAALAGVAYSRKKMRG